MIEPLLKTASEKELPNGWMIKSNRSSSVVFLGQDGEAVSIPKKRIADALEISYTYIDILYNPDFWDANTSVFKSAYKEPLLALFSFVDASGYYHYDQLREEANKRELSVERDFCYRQLCKAVDSNDLPNVEKYAVYAKEQTPYQGLVFPPLYVALKQRNKRIVKTLLANGAKLSEQLTDNGTVKNVLCGALESHSLPLLRQCLRENLSENDLAITMKSAQQIGRMDFIIELLKKGAPLTPGPEFNDLTVEEIIELVKYKSVNWNVEQISRVYASNNITAVKQMLKAAQYRKEPLIYAGTSSERWVSILNQSRIVQWIVSVGDESLIQFCSKQKYSIDIVGADYWKMLLDLPSSWAKPIRKMCLDKYRYKEGVQKAIHDAIKNRDLAAVQKLLAYYDAQIDTKCVRYASSDRYGGLKWKPINEETLAFVINHWSFPEAFVKGKDFNLWDRDRDFPWLFQAVIGSSSRELCLLLFEKLPEVFDCPSYISSMKYYCDHREKDDDIKDIFADTLAKHEKSS